MKTVASLAQVALSTRELVPLAGGAITPAGNYGAQTSAGGVTTCTESLRDTIDFSASPCESSTYQYSLSYWQEASGKPRYRVGAYSGVLGSPGNYDTVGNPKVLFSKCWNSTSILFEDNIVLNDSGVTDIIADATKLCK